MFEASSHTRTKTDLLETAYRSSSQPLLPQHISMDETGRGYQIYPYHSLEGGKIFSGYASLAVWMATHQQVVLDGYGGVLWKEVRHYLQEVFREKEIEANWINIDGYLKPAAEIQAMVAPFLGVPNSLWGTRCTRRLDDLFSLDAISELKPEAHHDLTIVYGTGAALVNWNAPLVYLDLPKNEIQYRMRAGSIQNLGCEEALDPAEAYKRFYFVDWVLLNAHKKKILDKISVVADAQWNKSINWMFGETLMSGLHAMSRSAFRVRPWFEPGAWGGQWMKEHLDGLGRKEVNYAWSFEMIVPENGLVFESNGCLLEVSFDFLMFAEGASVLGKHAALFGDEFPIRFDFLDTWDGGNLSIQCHPSLSYIQKEFGEHITQDETYYILDCKEGAQVYLGFQETVHPEEFRAVLEESRDKGSEVEIGRWVQAHPAHKHDLFLIPNGTVHSAGANNLVLEISATPYIFTFKMYDWLRLDLNGKPRAINIEHAFNNLRFERKGERVGQELISRPTIAEEGADWKLVYLPTHPEHFYDVHRLEFDGEVQVETNGSCHVLMLVEGSSIQVKTAKGPFVRYHYAETFSVPAAADRYTLINEGGSTAKVVKAFIKEQGLNPF
ncbi:MAG: class I mannose-6-phosphate isomerase [Williamsia sp.]|nr:class I mannose-6-phosphate isomerase [Williamsia sp.]